MRDHVNRVKNLTFFQINYLIKYESKPRTTAACSLPSECLVKNQMEKEDRQFYRGKLLLCTILSAFYHLLIPLNFMYNS